MTLSRNFSPHQKATSIRSTVTFMEIRSQPLDLENQKRIGKHFHPKNRKERMKIYPLSFQLPYFPLVPRE